MKKAVFLDRDGTLNPDPGYISDPADFNLFPGVAEALKRLQSAGYLLILITNQSGISRGLITVEQLETIHGKLQQQLSEAGCRLDAIYYCPHHPDFPPVDGLSDCNCRKPRPGMIEKALRDHDIDAGHSFMIGDRSSDIKIALATGVKPIYIGSSSHVSFPDVPAFKDLSSAAAYILSL